MSQQFPPLSAWPEPAVTGLVGITDGPIDFTPVPRQRNAAIAGASTGSGASSWRFPNSAA